MKNLHFTLAKLPQRISVSQVQLPWRSSQTIDRTSDSAGLEVLGPSRVRLGQGRNGKDSVTVKNG